MAIDDAARNKARIETEEHIFKVRALMLKVATALTNRGRRHDASKLEQPELDMFAEWGPKLKEMEYGTDEYKEALGAMGEALEHHYRNNSHHPEYYGDKGINGMDLIDLIEMTCDWVASTKRVKNGNYLESLEKNFKRFNLAPQLVRILANTAPFFEEDDPM